MSSFVLRDLMRSQSSFGTSARKCSLRASIEFREIIETISSFSSTIDKKLVVSNMRGGDLQLEGWGLTVSTELFRTLVSSVFNLDGNTSTHLTLLDNVLCLLVDLERGDLSERDHFAFLRFGIRLDHTQGSSSSKCSFDNVATENNG